MNERRKHFYLESGMILTAVSFLSSIVHFVFQGVMARMLPTEEFGYMSSTLGVILLASVPLTAASQTIAHYLARLKAEGNEEKLRRFRIGSQRWLKRGTWGLAILALLVFIPVRDFLKFPRSSLALAALVCLPAQLWSVLGSAWCAGLGRFQLLGFLTLGGAILRLAGGAACAYFLSQAEAGIAGTLFGACVIGASLFIHYQKEEEEDRLVVSEKPTREFLTFLAASISIGVANYLFLQSDQIVAQRHFNGIDLGNYSAAGVLGRAVIWGSLPFLTVYFTQRSEIDSTNRDSWRLKILYAGCLLSGVGVVMFFSEFLCQLLRGSVQMQTVQWMDDFSIAMLFVGILQAIGFFYLATRRFLECFVFGFMGLVYAATLTLYGDTPVRMLHLMQGTALVSIVVVAACSLLRWGKK